MLDKFQRSIEYVRISLTDRCNLRCRYCMPPEGVGKIQHKDILRFDEILAIIRALATLGVKKVRFTGGEPLIRRNICTLIRATKATSGIEKIALTTNGLLLGEMLEDLLAAGLDAVNISLDTLNEATFQKLTLRPGLERVLQSIDLAVASGIKTQVNVVPLENINEAEIPDLAALAKERDLNVRFIELMPVGCAFAVGLRGLKIERVKTILQNHYGEMCPCNKTKEITGPAVNYYLDGFLGKVGFIDALEHKFCSSCNRIRLTSEGFLKLCLYAKDGLDLRELLRSGCSHSELVQVIKAAIEQKPKEHYFLAKDHSKQEARYMFEVGG